MTTTNGVGSVGRVRCAGGRKNERSIGTVSNPFLLLSFVNDGRCPTLGTPQDDGSVAIGGIL